MMPLFIFFLILFGIPYLEISLFISVGQSIGALHTVLLCFLTAFIGVALIHKQGIDTIAQARTKMNENVLPEEEIMHGVALLFAGLCLLIPGFFTDAVGFTLLVPFLRRKIFQSFRGGSGYRVFYTHSDKNHSHHDAFSNPDTIEGKYRSLDKDKEK